MRDAMTLQIRDVTKTYPKGVQALGADVDDCESE